MEDAMTVAEPPLSVSDVREQVNLIQQVMREVMKEGTHYGKIPGAGDKPTLFKAGAEKLASTFRLGVDPVIEDLSSGDVITFRVKANIMESGSGRLLGAGVGQCSSAETKYQWRGAVCQEEFEQSPDGQKRVKWMRGKNGAWSQNQVRMNPADVGNTVLKMAKKRALIDGILTVTAASDIFTQDIEELPKEYLDRSPQPDENPSVISHPSAPEILPKSQRSNPPVNPNTITERQRKMLFAVQRSVNFSDADVKDEMKKLGLTCHRDAIPKNQFQRVLDAIDPEFGFHQRPDAPGQEMKDEK